MTMTHRDKKALMISSDPKLFERGSQVRERMSGYAKGWGELHIIGFCMKGVASNGRDEISENCFAYPTNSKGKTRYIPDALNIADRLMSEGFSWILCQDPFLTGIAGLSLKKRFSIPLEVSIHTDIGSPHYAYNIGNALRKWLGKYIIKRADHVRVVSDKIAKFVMKLGVKEEDIEIRPIGIDEDYFRNALIKDDIKKAYPQFSVIAFMASRIEPEKNIGLAIEAWKDIIRKEPDAGLIIVGEGSKKISLQEKINALGLERNVKFEPWAHKSKLASYYKSADIFLLTSLFEGYGMTLAEAKASGCKKIISTDVGIAREVGAKIIGFYKADLTKAILE